MLIRPNVPRPDQPARTVTLFADWQPAVQHLCDHVLSAPECQAWAIVLEGQTLPVKLDDANARWHYAEQARQPCGGLAQALLDPFATTVIKASTEASQLGWHRSDGPVTVALGISGVLLVIDGSTVVTAFLPGQGEVSATVEARSQEPGKPLALPRERGMRCRPAGSSDTAIADREQRLQQQRQQNWSNEERLYYQVFKPAVQFIRSRYHSSRDLTGRARRCDYALLKESLPPFSQLRLEHWRQLRQPRSETVTP